MDADGNPIPHAFGIGLAAGFVPHGKLGGEPSFMGQANGLWLWQSDVGGMIVDAILDPPDGATDLLESPAFTCYEHTLAAQEVEI
jgi:hypothetical protein